MSRIMPLSVLLLLASMPQLAAQVDDASRYDSLFHSSGSEVSGQIPSRLVDPFTTTAQVDRFLEFLKLPYQFEWDGTTTLRDIQKDIARHFPLEIDIYAIEEIGLSDDDAIHEELAPKHTAVTNRQTDFFGNSPATKPAHPAGDARTGKQEEHEGKWWLSDRLDSAQPITVTNGAQLFFFLDHIECTLNVKHGLLVITTRDEADSQGCIRIFDVTRLVNLDASSGTNLHGVSGPPQPSSFYDVQSLIDLIQTAIEPDSWEVLGGFSTMRSHSTQNRCWLVVSSSLMIHWKIDAMLNRLCE